VNAYLIADDIEDGDESRDLPLVTCSLSWPADPIMVLLE